MDQRMEYFGEVSGNHYLLEVRMKMKLNFLIAVGRPPERKNLFTQYPIKKQLNNS